MTFGMIYLSPALYKQKYFTFIPQKFSKIYTFTKDFSVLNGHCHLSPPEGAILKDITAGLVFIAEILALFGLM